MLISFFTLVVCILENVMGMLNLKKSKLKIAAVFLFLASREFVTGWLVE